MALGTRKGNLTVGRIILLLFLAIPSGVAPAVAGSLPEYHLSLIPVGSQPGGIRNIFGAINDNGQILSFHAHWQRSKSLDSFSPAFYDGHTFEPLGTLGGTQSVAYAINAAGHATGASDMANGKSHAFLSIGGRLRDLGTLGGDTSMGLAVNDDDIVVGQSDAADGAPHAFVWRDGHLSDFNDLLPADTSLTGGESYVLASASAINNKGDVILWARTGSGHYLPLLLRLGRFAAMRPPASWSAITSAASLKDDGSFTGSYVTANNIESAFVFDRNGFHEIGSLGGASRTYALNSTAEAVGESRDAQGLSHAVLWNGSALLDLNALFSPSLRTANGLTFRLASATGINADGTIVGVAWEDGPLPHHAVFILTPVLYTAGASFAFLGLLAFAALAAAVLHKLRPDHFARIKSSLVFDATDTASAASKSGLGLLADALVLAVILAGLRLFGGVPLASFADPFVYALSGVAILQRKSPVVASLATIYAALTLFFTLVFPSGMMRTFVTALGALFALFFAAQAWRACHRYRTAYPLEWHGANIAVVGGATAAGFLVTFIVLAFGARFVGMTLENSNVAALVVALAAVVALLGVMRPLAAKRPLATAARSTA